MLTYDAILGALRTIQREYEYALKQNNRTLTDVWYNERSRVLAQLLAHPDHPNRRGR